jgi:hypothetical protein
MTTTARFHAPCPDRRHGGLTMSLTDYLPYGADIIDSRDLLALDPDDLEPDDLASLEALRLETEHYSGDSFADGVAFIAEDYFEEYARELATDIGAVDPNASWPNGYIDWTRAADALKQDYTSVDIDGRTYWYR